MKKLLILGMAVMAVSSAQAQLLGASVFGNLMFNGVTTTNYFDPTNGLVPTGYLNTAGPTVTIANPAKEFGFDDSVNRDEADFTANTLTIHDVSQAGSVVYRMQFTSSAFIGLTCTQISSTFPVTATKTLVGNLLTIDMPTFGAAGDYTAVFQFTAVPEPTSIAAIGLGLAFLIRRRRK
jgi:hypothetical protein